jgi:AcrR family transcriptional regulator
MGMPERKSAEARREQIIATALDLAHEVGPDRMTTEAIARRIGLTQAAVFRHFPRKSDIWVAVVDWLRRRLAGQWADTLALGLAPTDTLRALAIGQFLFIETAPALPAILMSRELQADGGVLGQAIGGVMDAFRHTLAALVREGQRQGDVRPNLDSDQTAFALIALIQGTALRWVMQGRSFDLVAEGKAVITIVIDGVRARPG